MRRSLTELLRETLDPQVPTRDALEALGYLKNFLQEHEAHLVSYARDEGVSWGEIGDALGRSPELLAQLYRSRLANQ
jgi:hypothetical protein